MPADTKKKKGEENKDGKDEEDDVIKDKDDDDDDISDKAELKINSDVRLTHLQQTLSLILFPMPLLSCYFSSGSSYWPEGNFTIPDYSINNNTGLKFHHLLSLNSYITFERKQEVEGMGGKGSVFLGLHTKGIYICTRYWKF